MAAAMRLTIVVVIALILQVRPATIIVNEENAVIQATPDTIGDLIRSHPHLVVYYYTSWCSSCSQIAVEFENTAKYAKLRNLQLPFIKVDCDEREDTAPGFPNIALVINLNSVYYEGEASSPSILDWLDRKLNNPVTVITNIAAYKRNLESNKAVIVYNGDVQSHDYKVFEQVARLTDESIKFLSISDTAVKKALLASWRKHNDKKTNNGSTTIAVFRTYDETELYFNTDSITFDKLQAFVNFTKEEAVIKFEDKAAAAKVFNSIGTSLIWFSDSTHPDEHIWLRSLSARYFGVVKVVHSRINKGLGRDLSLFFDIDTKKRVQLLLIHVTESDIEKYKYYFSLDKDYIEDFVKNFLSGRMNPQNAMINENDILLDFGKRNVADFEYTPNVHLRFHYSEKDCKLGSRCSKMKAAFKRVAMNFHYLNDVEFCLIDHEMILAQSSTKTVSPPPAPLPFVALYDPKIGQPQIVADFQFKFDFITYLLQERLGRNIDIWKNLRFPELHHPPESFDYASYN